ncbi:MAG: HD domain-containing phosphohydrolase [bacterium]
MNQQAQAMPKVLIVDDEANIRKVLREMARRVLGAETWEASNGQEALVLFREASPDVVLSDIRMPGMDGISLLRAMKEERPNVPVILITGYPSLDVAIQGMKEGASDFITKPFRLDQLQVILEKALREKKLLEDNEGLRQQVQHKKTLERLNEELNRKVREMSALCSLGQTIAAFPLNRDAILKSLVHETRSAVQAMWVQFLAPHEGGVITLARSPDQPEGTDLPPAPEVPRGLLERALRLRTPILGPRLFLPSDPSAAGKASGQNFSQMLVPLVIKGEVIGVVHAAGKLESMEFDRHDLLLVSELAKRAALGLENKYLYESLFDVLMSTLRSLVSTVEARDLYTKQHSQRVTDIAVIIAQHMGCTPEQIDTLRVAGYLHDLGKLGIKDSVLLKPGPLTPEEFDQIKAHPVIGEEILAPIGFLPEERALVRHHHERWDGRGYPDGLREEKIPLLARILAVADVFDALTSDRPYRPAMSVEKGAAEIKACCGTQFDPAVVNAFLEVLEQCAQKVVNRDNGSMAGRRAIEQAMEK